jgi:hypothetical protein
MRNNQTAHETMKGQAGVLIPSRQPLLKVIDFCQPFGLLFRGGHSSGFVSGMQRAS